MNTVAIIKYFQYYYREFLIRRNFIFIPTHREQTSIKNFLLLTDKYYGNNSLGKDFLDKYFSYQFLYWSKLKTRFEDHIPISWCIGQKAFKRYIEKNPKSVYIISKEVKELKISKEKHVNDIKIFELINEVEEQDKKKYHNAENGLSNCILFTTLYHPLSDICNSCNERKNCMIIQKETYPLIAELRNG